MTELKSRIERYVAGVPAGEERHAREAVDQLREALATGIVRAAERHADGKWHANAWVKSGILLGFRLGVIVAAAEGGPFTFFDKDTWPVRRFRITDGVRIVPGGSAIRDGAYVDAHAMARVKP